MFTYETKIRMHDTDAAGRLFFANQFKLVHDAYEVFMESLGIPLASLLKSSDYHLPIVHAETDLTAPLLAGDEVKVILTLLNVGNTSFTLHHEIFNKEKVSMGKGKTVHVCVDGQTGKPFPLPCELKDRLLT